MSLLLERDPEGEGPSVLKLEGALISGFRVSPLLRLRQVLHHPALGEYLLHECTVDLLVAQRELRELQSGGYQLRLYALPFPHDQESRQRGGSGEGVFFCGAAGGAALHQGFDQQDSQLLRRTHLLSLRLLRTRHQHP